MLGRRAVLIFMIAGILLGVGGCYLIAVSKPVVQREAETDAALRLLAEFHEEYLTRRGVPLDEYRAALAALKEKHSDLKDLRRYAEKVRAR